MTTKKEITEAIDRIYDLCDAIHMNNATENIPALRERVQRVIDTAGFILTITGGHPCNP